MKKIRVCVADDSGIYLEGIQSLISQIHFVELVASGRNAASVLNAVAKQPVDIVITDIVMPDKSGIELAQILARDYPSIKVIALTMFLEDDLVADMISAGAMGYLNKNMRPEYLEQAITSVAKGDYYYCPTTTLKLVRMIAAAKVNAYNVHSKLNEQEVAIVRLICQEYLNKEIADKLKLSYHTIETYRNRIQVKLGVKGTAGIVVWALKNGVVK
jgi:DNA-binding NarL/FixJ family response regulator